MNFIANDTQCPIGNGAGICKNAYDLRRLLKTGVAAIEIGSITELERFGNEGNIFYSGKNFTLNSLGLPNPGRKHYEFYMPAMINEIHRAGKKAIVNVAGFTMEEYGSLTRYAFDWGADYVVENFGCPNIWIEGIQKGILSYDLVGFKKTSLHVISQNKNEAKEGRIGVKFSPIFDSQHMKEIAIFLNDIIEIPIQETLGFIGFITTQNTVPNCYYEESNTSVISPAGGLSGMAGNAIFPMALSQVKQFRQLLSPKIKIIGVGGINSGEDMYKMIRNGANFVQVTSAYYPNEDLGVFDKIGAEYLELKEK